MIDPKGRTNTFAYDAQGIQIAHWLPHGQMESNAYVPWGVYGAIADFNHALEARWTSSLANGAPRT